MTPISVITKLNVLLALLVTAMLGLAVAGWYAGGARTDWFAAAAAGWMLLAIAGAVYLRLSIRQGILRSIRGAAHVIGRVAEGDLTVKVNVSAHGETQKMLEGLQAMTDDLHDLV